MLVHAGGCLYVHGEAVAGYRLKWQLKSLERTPDNKYLLRYDTPEGQQELVTRSVALTVPAYVVADLVRPQCPDASDALRSLDYPPVAAVTLAYPMSAIRPDRLNDAGELPGGCLLWALPMGGLPFSDALMAP